MPTAQKSNGSDTEHKGHPMTDTLSQSAHDAVEIAAKQVGKVEGTIREKASTTSDSVSDNAEILELKAKTAIYRTRALIAEKPLVAAGAAFAAGFLVTSLLSKSKNS